jgi:hypothetical protein
VGSGLPGAVERARRARRPDRHRGARAAVVAPEKEVGRWFAFRREVVEGLVADGRLERPEPGWLAAT